MDSRQRYDICRERLSQCRSTIRIIDSRCRPNASAGIYVSAVSDRDRNGRGQSGPAQARGSGGWTCSDQRHAAGRRIETDFDQHLDEFVVRHAKLPRFIDDVEADRCAGEIADARDQSHHRTRAERKSGTGDTDRRVQQPRQPAHAAKSNQTVDILVSRFCLVLAFICHAAAFIILARRLIPCSSERCPSQ